ncbi:MAG: glycosyltransferase [Bacteroidaceae bacterium]|nr:glycosyltransferase [Bacteroidaceae bacterium]
MKLSVIVPVYNVERFLPRCLDSLLRQGLEVGEYEIICVNDGSPDGSAKVLEKYALKFPDVFRVITQENQGLGGARNTGTALAKGEWVAYLDSDDYLVDGAYRYLLDHFCGPLESGPLAGKELDVLCYTCHNVYTDGISLADPDAKPDGEVTYEGDGVEAFNRWSLHYVWSKFYRRAFLEEHHIESEIVICQDQLFNFDVFRQHPNTRIVTSSIVRYENGNAGSIQKLTDRETVLIQLNDLYFNMSIIRHYLDEGITEMEPAAHRLIDNFQKNYYKKMLNASLTRDDWKRYTQILNVRRMAGTSLKYETTLAGKAVAVLKFMAGHSYFEYSIIRFFYRNVFKRFLFSKMITR